MDIRFPKLVGRSYGYRSTAQTGAPEPPQVVPARRILSAGSQPDEISSPASRRIVGGREGPNTNDRGYIAHTEDQLNLGPLPDRINRDAQGRNAGKIGVGAFPGGIAGWPYDGNALRSPHQVIPRKPITVTAFQRSIDTSVTIPAGPGIGGPVG
jgi:hypothetical protein